MVKDGIITKAYEVKTSSNGSFYRKIYLDNGDNGNVFASSKALIDSLEAGSTVKYTAKTNASGRTNINVISSGGDFDSDDRNIGNNEMLKIDRNDLIVRQTVAKVAGESAAAICSGMEFASIEEGMETWKNLFDKVFLHTYDRVNDPMFGINFPAELKDEVA